MYFVYRVLLLIVYHGIFVHGQGGGGGSSGGGSSGSNFGSNTHYYGSSSNSGSSGSSCTTDECRRNTGIILGSIFGGILVIAVTIVSTCCGCRYWKGRARRTNAVFVNSASGNKNTQESHEVNHYQSGKWSSKYFQYGRWQKPYQVSLEFDPYTTKATGSGTDSVGQFTMDGTYSTGTNRIGLTKKYELGTGNWSENLGHDVTIQLIWNPNDRQFDGKWYVHTSKYRGEDKFTLKFDGQ